MQNLFVEAEANDATKLDVHHGVGGVVSMVYRLYGPVEKNKDDPYKQRDLQRPKKSVVGSLRRITYFAILPIKEFFGRQHFAIFV